MLAAFSTMGASALVESAWREEAAIANIRALENDIFSEAPGSPGIARHLAFKGDNFLVVRSRGPGRSLWLASPRGLRRLWLHRQRIGSLREWSRRKGCHLRWSGRFLPRPGTHGASRCQSVWQRGSGGDSVSAREWADGYQRGRSRPSLAPYRGLRERLLRPSISGSVRL